ncbi:hypothetical protein REPUB_Repub13aG0132500 [Reevesia pubescens]
MDALGVRQMKSNKKHSKRSNYRKDIKVVYISSPMKVNTCASQFRALVQELTRKDSDAAVRFMDNDDNSNTESSPTNSDATRVVDHPVLGNLANSNHQSMFQPFDDGFMSEGSFLGMFTSNLFHDPSQFDDIRSFGSV